jgi:hypothetical protein
VTAADHAAKLRAHADEIDPHNVAAEMGLAKPLALREAAAELDRLAEVERERDQLRDVNESVAVCADPKHWTEIVGNGCRVCDVEAANAKLAEVERALREEAEFPCVYTPNDAPCPDEWPDEQQKWCGPCLARHALAASGETETPPCDSLRYAEGCKCARCVAHARSRYAEAFGGETETPPAGEPLEPRHHETGTDTPEALAASGETPSERGLDGASATAKPQDPPRTLNQKEET